MYCDISVGVTRSSVFGAEMLSRQSEDENDMAQRSASEGDLPGQNGMSHGWRAVDT